MNETLTLLKKLIACRSITPHDAGCQDILISRLQSAGFHIERLPFENVENFWAWHGDSQPTLIFAGHTDVVPPGDESQWTASPFEPVEKDGYLYGRGSVDMKSGLSAMAIAAINFVQQNPDHPGTIGFIVTSDEEGPALHGTQRVVSELQKKGFSFHYCIVGEATSNHQLGDAIKIGRRGSLYGDLTIIGKQGHIAYPHLAENPIHRAFQAFDALAQMEWDQGNQHFTPTSFQFYRIHSDGGASNVIPQQLKAYFNFRYAPVHSTEQLQQKCEGILKKYGLNYELKWDASSLPYYSGYGKLAQICSQVIEEMCDIKTEPNTYGGTSDGRFIAQTGCEVVEFGPVNTTAHHINENIRVDDLKKLTQIYERILERTFTGH